MNGSNGFENLRINSPQPGASLFHSDEDSACADMDRWATLSAEDSSSQVNGSDRVKDLEEEHQKLTESVLSLSSRFAHIQFRLQQIHAAPAENREEMLKELLEFASEGCVDISGLKEETRELREYQKSGQLSEEVDQKRSKVLSLIESLRSQTEDLERFAYENGHGGMPMNELKQRQKMVFDKLQEKICLKIELDKVSELELQKNVDKGIEELLNPIKEKDQLVDQLQTQITDLERFVSYLQTETVMSDEFSKSEYDDAPRSIESAYRRPNTSKSLFGIFPFGGQRKFEKNELKRTPLGNHYGDQRAQLELAVGKVLEVLKQRQLLSIEHPEREEMSVEERNEKIFEMSDEAVVSVVRKQLATCLRALLEHGMKSTANVEVSLGSLGLSTLGFGCVSQRGTAARLKRQESIGEGKALTHIWDIIVLFYETRKAQERRDAVFGSLSQTFNLDSVLGKSATSQQILMSTIEHVITSHEQLKRSMDSMWKAFVSAALNQKCLPVWLRMILRADFIMYRCYHSWSYVCRTGCEDMRPLFDQFNEYSFELPVDLAIRPFDHIREAF